MTHDAVPRSTARGPRNGGKAGRRVRAALMAALLALQPLGAPTGLSTSPAVAPLAASVVASVAGVAVSTVPGDAWARASSSRSSGGYSRPSSSMRTPSVRAPSSSGGSGGYSRPSAPRTPSTNPYSGGYARPGNTAPSVAAPPQSAGDRAFSQQGSSDALGRYRQQQDAARAPAAPPPSAGTRPTGNQGGNQSGSGWNSGSSWGWGTGRTPSTRTSPTRPAPYQNPNAYNRYGWSPPPYAVSAPRRFGVWDGLFLWFMLDTLTRPGHASFFHDNANDPGYRDWRAEAERQAKDNTELRAKLDQLDQTLKTQEGTPREAGRLPADVPPELARADVSQSSETSTSAAGAAPSGSSGFVWWGVLLLGIGILFLLWRARRRMEQPRTPGQPAATTAKTKPKGGSDVPLFGTLGNYVNQKLSGQRYSPSLFRLGMAVSIDPAPFLLAEGVTKVKAPDTGTDRLVSIDSVGTVTSGNATVHRLHLPDGGFFQIHLGPDGQPDECRYFTPIDSVTPADEGEWAFWLDEREGMIGWPEFQTKDGKLYPRVWAPGGERIQPFILSEALETVRGSETVVSHAMLYGASTGSPAPAPEREYILIEAVERDGKASVQIAAGIDVNPASLSLS